MTSTGIVRRINQNGTIVIPKEVRKTLSIEDGDPFEIFIGENNEIILKQYIPEQQTHTTPSIYYVSTKVNLKKLFGRDFVAWHDVLKNRLGFDEKIIGFQIFN